MAQDERTIDPGRIQFYHHAKPPLPAGAHTITVEHTVDLSKIRSFPPLTGPMVMKFSQSQTLHVEGPRFGLLPRDLQAAYPPPNRQGPFTDTLPHVVLRRRTLPWEIRITEDGPNQMLRPWMALLLFHADETVTGSTITLSQLTAPGAGKLGPDIVVDKALIPEPAEVSLNVVDVPASLFQAVAPFKTDLEFLAHVRQVNTGGKELLGLNEDGWFSVVLANRLPAVGVNQAYLVSLEGWQGRLRSEGVSPSLPAGTTHCRLVSLANWTFVADPGNGSFGQLLGNVDPGVLAMGGEPATGLSGPELSVAKTLQVGYVPLAYDQRSGEHTVGWYRGPLAPVNWDRVPRKPFPNAEAAMIYDQETGIFDVSYAVAWQIGRMLALNDSAFSKSLSRWRQQAEQFKERILELQALRLDLERESLFERLDVIQNMQDPAEKEKAMVDFVNSLDDPQAGAAVAAAAFLKAAVDGDAVPASDGKQRLTRALVSPAPAELEALTKVPLGPQRIAELSKLLFRDAIPQGPA